MKRTTTVLGACSVLGLVVFACSIPDLSKEKKVAETASSAPGETKTEKAPIPSTSPKIEHETDRTMALSEVLKRSNVLNQQPTAISPLGDSASSLASATTGLVARDRVRRPFPGVELDRERYQDIDANPVRLVSEEPVSTFSVDVDTASYANIRRFLEDGVMPPVDAVRVEELINYFNYDYEAPAERDQPFATDISLFTSPWDEGSQLLRIGIKGYELEAVERPPANLVFLVDTSGSMASPDKLPLLQRSLRMLVEEMRDEDRIAIVAYAGNAGVVLEPTFGSDKAKIIRAIEMFQAGGRTAGSEGLRKAYQLAEAGFDEAAINRVILATDGDFNVGINNPERLEDFIGAKRETGVYLSILGFGRGNLNDLLMQKLAQAGNGNASYIDGLMEARKVLVDEMGSTLFTIADDVKIQIEFNPKKIAEYRLIGYETRMLAREDFNNDSIDAGEIGSGHRVTALYEVTPPESSSRLIDDLRYGGKETVAGAADQGKGEIAWLRLRYKQPGEEISALIEQPVLAEAATSFEAADSEARFATAVAAFGQRLRQGAHLGAVDFDAILEMAEAARGNDPFGYRAEFMQLVRLAKSASLLEPSGVHGPKPGLVRDPKPVGIRKAGNG